MKHLINAVLKAKLPSKGHPGVIRRGEHDDVSHDPALLDEPADNLGMRSLEYLGVVSADEKRSIGFLLQALGKRPTAERHNLGIICLLQIEERQRPDCELRDFSHTTSIWHPREKANGKS